MRTRNVRSWSPLWGSAGIASSIIDLTAWGNAIMFRLSAISCPESGVRQVWDLGSVELPEGEQQRPCSHSPFPGPHLGPRARTALDTDVKLKGSFTLVLEGILACMERPSCLGLFKLHEQTEAEMISERSETGVRYIIIHFVQEEDTINSYNGRLSSIFCFCTQDV